ncbi:MAG: T9SS type A sorting domain-containing protein [Crocinitomicaceae bacterium]
MKNILLFTLGLFVTNLALFGQNVNIPDSNFKAYLVGNLAINTNGDTEIQISEANAFTGEINCSLLNISDLTGIEAFTSLTDLKCNDNNLTSLSLTQNTALMFLQVAVNSLTSLDISQNVNLIRLVCPDNDLTSIDISNNPSIELLGCSHNALTNLDVANGNNLNFIGFFAQNNPDLTCIKVDDVAYSSTNWTGIDTIATFSLTCGSLSVNDLESSKNITIYPNPVKSQVHIDTDKNIESVTIIDSCGKVITKILTDDAIIDLSNLANGIYFMRIHLNSEIVTKKFIKN